MLVIGSDTEAAYHYTPTKEGRHISDFLTLGTDAQGNPIVWKGTITAHAPGHHGARRLCTVLTLIHTARLLNVDPYDYLEWALTRVVPHPDNRGYKTKDLNPAACATFLAGQANNRANL